MEVWSKVQERIDACRRCESDGVPYLRVPTSRKRHPQFDPPQPTRIYFVSVAPPWSGAYFWDESRADAVRDGLFDALRRSLGEPLRTCADFHRLGFHLSPAVKCPSEEDGKDHFPPAGDAIQNCREHLRTEFECAQPERILALGGVPFKTIARLFSMKVPKNVEDCHGRIWWVSLGKHEIPVSTTYFPGNNRHGGLQYVPADIGNLLAVAPKPQAP